MNRKASLLEQSANAVVDRYRTEFDVYMAEINREGVGFSLLGFRERLKNSGKPKVKGEENLLRFAREFIAEVNRRPETIKGSPDGLFSNQVLKGAQKLHQHPSEEKDKRFELCDFCE